MRLGMVAWMQAAADAASAEPPVRATVPAGEASSGWGALDEQVMGPYPGEAVSVLASMAVGTLGEMWV